MKLNRHGLLILGLAGAVLEAKPSQAPLVITEFMAENVSSLLDEDGEASDWIEIHNASAALQSLDGWSLTDDAKTPAKWRFPGGIQMPANSYLIVFASGKNRTNATHLHTNFKLSAGGEYLGLIDPLGTVASDFGAEYPAQREDISYGRDAADFSLELFFPAATPGARNATGGPGFAPEVGFSRPSGTFSAAEGFTLVLETASSSAEIYYTVGTNVPGVATLRYTHPLEMTNSSIIRARAIESGLLPGPITSRTYVALGTGVLGFSSDLPLMILHNFGQGAVLASGEEQYVAMQTFEPALSLAAQAPRSSLTNAPDQAERGVFHVRGFLTAVTSTLGKSSFLLELQDELGADKDLPLLGLPEESDWVLYAPNAWDIALFQNPMAHQLFRAFGGYASRTRFFELFLKDDSGRAGPVELSDYYGLFVLEERIKRDQNRVDIESLQPEHTAAPEISGGYMFSIDETNGAPRLTAGGAVLNWEYPTGFEMTNALRAPQLGYIRNYLNTFNAVLQSPGWTDPVFGYRPYIDVNGWIDYHLHCVVTFSPDALRLSTYLYKPRGQPLNLGPPWDFDRSQGSADLRDFNPVVWRSPAGSDYFNEPPWWPRLFRDPDFWQRWIDRYQELRNGPLALDNLHGLIDGYALEVREAQGREQARWNVLPRAGLTNASGFSYNFGAATSYDNEIRFKKDWYALRLGFMDTQFLARPVLNHAPGLAEPGVALAVIPAAKPGSSILCRLDGGDPRLPGGGISPAALSNLGPLVLNVTNNMRVVARSYNPGHRNLTGPNNPPVSSPWSGPVEATFFTELPPLRITEIMYHPESPPPGATFQDEDYEFIEVKNIGAAPLNLLGFKLSGGVSFQFPPAVLGPGELAVVVANTNAFVSRYPWRPRLLGAYTNRLDNAGERLVLEGPLGEPILDFVYDDDWYPLTDGLGFSLVHKDPRAPPESWNAPEQWRPSALPGAFPADDDPQPARFPRVVVNEVWSGGAADAIELCNLSDQTARIGGWFLTDDFRNPKKFSIPIGTEIGPGGCVVFEGLALGFTFNPLGEEAYLFAADEGTLMGYAHGFDFGPNEHGFTFGRHVASSGAEHFPAQAFPTPKAENAGPRVGPVVLSEIHYHPPDHEFESGVFDNTEDEFVELYNGSDAPMPLFDPADPTQTWRLDDAVSFEFPAGSSIPPLGLALVVGFDARNEALNQAFRARHSVPFDAAIFGPFAGKLDNSSDRVELLRPLRLAGAAGEVTTHMVVERVRYSDTSPWPAAADGLSRSLQRIDPGSFGNDPANWSAAEPNPGRLGGGAAGPVVTLQPADATVTAGAAAAFDVQAEGPAPLVFQWRLNGKILPQATRETLVLENVLSADAGDYDVVVMNPANSATSRKARLTVLSPVRIALQPRSQMVDEGARAYLTVVALGEGPVTHQWRFNGAPMPGRTGPVLNVPGVAEGDQGFYDVVVANPAGTVASAAATLAVRLPPSLLAPSPPLALSATPGQVLTLGVELRGTFPLWLRWRLAGPGGSQILGEEVLPSPGPLPAMLTQGVSYLAFQVQPNSGGSLAVIATNAASSVLITLTNAYLTVLEDADLDQMPDVWETSMGLRPQDPADALEDEDHDGISNRGEYVAGTDPLDAQSFPRLDVKFQFPATGGPEGVGAGQGQIRLEFSAVSNRTYTVQYADRLPAGAWTRLQDVLARATNQVEIMTDSIVGTQRYYRLVTPAR